MAKIMENKDAAEALKVTEFAALRRGIGLGAEDAGQAGGGVSEPPAYLAMQAPTLPGCTPPSKLAGGTACPSKRMPSWPGMPFD